MGIHRYEVKIKWDGNIGSGTASYQSYKRDHIISKNNKKNILCSSDPSFLGDEQKWNPEELFISSIAACHKLWYLHFCSSHHIIVISYEDLAQGIMADENEEKIGFTSITLNPKIIITPESDQTLAHTLHKKAHEYCFLANSINFEIKINPIICQ